MGLLQGADPAAVLALDAEQLGLHRLGQDGGGVEQHEGPVRPRRGPVQGPRGELLARAERARDHHAGIGRRDPLQGLAQLVHRERPADDLLGRAGAGLEVANLAPQPRGLQRPLGHEDQPVRLERLLDEVVGARLDRRDGGLDVAVARDHHHRQVGMGGLDQVEHLEPVEARALQPDVEEDEVRAARFDRGQGLVGAACRAAAVPSSSRMPATRSRMSASSSTIRISALMPASPRSGGPSVRRPSPLPWPEAALRPERRRPSPVRLRAAPASAPARRDRRGCR